MEDLQIIELYFERNENAIKETDTKYGRLCFRVANNILKNNEDSKECVSDTYLSTWNQIPPTRPSNFMAFLCKITRNLSLKRMKFLTAAKRTSETTVSFNEIEGYVSDDQLKGNISDIELGMIFSKFLWSQNAVARNVFIRRYWFFDSVSEIAVRYSFSESKVKSMLFHTRNRLRDYLRKEGIDVYV